MNKKILIITVLIIFIVSFITSFKDDARVRNGMEPKYVIKVVSKDGSKVTYWGLGYKVIRYVKVSPSEPFENNIGVKSGSWFMNYEIDNNELSFIIVDKVNDGNLPCDEALEKFYTDDNYTYYWNCIKNEHVIVKYNDGSNELVSDALVNKHITIDDLKNFEIDYILYDNKKEEYLN